MRANALTVIHKYLRRELFQVSHRLSCAGPGDAEAVRDALEQTSALLLGHGEHEAAMLEPALRAVDPAFADRMLSDHARLDAELESVRRAAQALGDLAQAERTPRLLQLYLDWNRFVAAYLAHLDDEERTLFPELPGETLGAIAVVARNAAARGVDQAAAFLDDLGTLLAPDERDELTRAWRELQARAPA